MCCSRKRQAYGNAGYGGCGGGYGYGYGGGCGSGRRGLIATAFIKLNEKRKERKAIENGNSSSGGNQTRAIDTAPRAQSEVLDDKQAFEAQEKPISPPSYDDVVVDRAVVPAEPDMKGNGTLVQGQAVEYCANCRGMGMGMGMGGGCGAYMGGCGHGMNGCGPGMTVGGCGRRRRCGMMC